MYLATTFNQPDDYLTKQILTFYNPQAPSSPISFFHNTTNSDF